MLVSDGGAFLIPEEAASAVQDTSTCGCTPDAPADASPVSGIRFGPVRFGAPVNCPSCGRRFTAEWQDTDNADQECPSCGAVFGATCPGFPFRPRTVAGSGTSGP